MKIAKSVALDRAFEIVTQRGWLSTADAEHCELLKSIATLRHLPEGKQIFAFNQAASGMIGVVSGSVRLELLRNNEVQFPAYRPGPGFWVGHYACLTGKPHLLACQTAEPTLLIWLPRVQLLELLAKNPTLNHAFYDLTYRHMKNVLQILGGITAINNPARIAGRLLMEHKGRADKDGWIHITQQELAEMVSVSLPTVHRVIRSLVEKHVIEVSYGRMKIINESELRLIVANTYSG